MINPVFRREIRTVLRTWKTYAAIVIYGSVILLVAGLFLYSMHNSAMGFDPSYMTQLYILMTAFQLGLVLLITPALTAGAISGERERQTLDLMVITKMSAFSIVAGKLLSSLTVVFLMIIATMPVFAIIFYYGGVSIISLLGMVLFTMLTSAMVGSMAILLSCLIKRTIGSSVIAYVLIILCTIGTFILAFFLYIFTDNYYYYNNGLFGSGITINLILNFFIFALNPFMSYVSVVDSQIGTDYCWELLCNMSHMYSYRYISFLPPLWVFNIILYGGVIALTLFLTTRILNPVRNANRFK